MDIVIDSEMTPTIHLNGTGREALMTQVLDAVHAFDMVLTALCAMEPHGRDYYPQGANALRHAQREHGERYDAVRAVYLDLRNLALRIDRAGRDNPLHRL
jgi:hypothetical protein